MATLGANNLNLLDVAKRLDPNGELAIIAELLMQENEALQDIPMLEGNEMTGHRMTVRTGLPSVVYRKLNSGVPASKSRTAQVTEAAALLEGFSEVDREIARLGGNQRALRFSEDQSFMEAIRQQWASTLIYGDTDVNPERHLGLAPRFDDLSGENAANIIDAGGTGSDNMSVWLVVWAPNKVFGFYPNGTRAGIEFNDLGLQLTTDSSGNKIVHLVSQYIHRFGLAVKDWRYIVRICNIDKSDLTKDASGSSTDLVDNMVDALERVQSLDGNAAFIVPRTVRNFLRRQITNRANVNLVFENVAGKRVMLFDEVPVRRMDALLDTESQIT